ncbi:MAG TPA: hypothetical protein VE685_12415 [Thermoanaerobaculia bacterium]|nr:hypothetical protein [Thermoanaerobaculia bacterium]
MIRQEEPLATLDCLSGGGEMGALMRSFGWSSSPFGPVGGWPQSLRTAVSILINSRYPMFLFWGPALAQLYNDGYRPILGAKHPWALGRQGPEVWPEIWDTIAADTAEARTVPEACRLAARVLEDNAADLPFALVYLFEEGGRRARLAASAGVEEGEEDVRKSREPGFRRHLTKPVNPQALQTAIQEVALP